MLTVLRELAEEAERGAACPILAVADSCAPCASGDDALARRRVPRVIRRAGVVDAAARPARDRSRLSRPHRRADADAPVVLAPIGLDASTGALDFATARCSSSRPTSWTSTGSSRAGGSATHCWSSATLRGEGHVHTDDPGPPVARRCPGRPRGGEIADITGRREEREPRCCSACVTSPRSSPSSPARAAASFTRRGATQVVETGRTMNPWTADILAAVETTTAPSVVILPNDTNVLMSSEQAAAHASKGCAVSFPSVSIQAGLAAMVAFDPSALRRARTPLRLPWRVGPQSRPAQSRRFPGTWSANGVSCGVRARGSALLGGEPVVVGGESFDGGRERGTRGAVQSPSCAALSHPPHRRGSRPSSRGLPRRAGEAASRSSSSTCRTAASPTMRCSSRPNDGDPGRGRRGQRRLPERPRGAAHPRRRDRDRRLGVERGEHRRALRGAGAGRARRRLPAAGARRRPGHEARPGALPERRRRRAHRGRRGAGAAGADRRGRVGLHRQGPAARRDHRRRRDAA